MAFLEPILEEVDAKIIPLFGDGGPAAAEQAPPNLQIPAPYGFSKPPPGWHQVTSWGQIFHAIFGGARTNPNPNALTQAQVNARLSVIVAEQNAALASASQYLDNQDAWLQLQIDSNRSTAVTELNGAVAALNVEINSIANILAGKSAAAQNAATAAANRYTDSAVNGEKAARVAADNQITHWLQGAEASTTAQVAKALAEGEAYTNGKVATEAAARGAAVKALQQQINTNEAKDQAGLANLAGALPGLIANGVAVSEAYARDLVPGTVALAVTDTLQAVQPQIDRLATAVDDCLEPLCDTVTPNANQLGKLGNFLKGLEGLALPALLVALVAEAVADPSAAAGQIVDATGWATTALTDLVSDVVG